MPHHWEKLEQSYHHEASHGVAAQLLGIPVDEIIVDRFHGNGTTRFLPNEVIGAAARLALVAGCVGVELVRARDPAALPPTQSRQLANDLAQWRGYCPDRRAALTAMADWLYDDVEAAITVLAPHLETIRTLAKFLGTGSGPQARLSGFTVRDCLAQERRSSPPLADEHRKRAGKRAQDVLVDALFRERQRAALANEVTPPPSAPTTASGPAGHPRSPRRRLALSGPALEYRDALSPHCVAHYRAG